MDWALIGLMLGLIGIVAGAAWRFGKVEKGYCQPGRSPTSRSEPIFRALISGLAPKSAKFGRMFATSDRMFARCGGTFSAYSSDWPRRPSELRSSPNSPVAVHR